MAGVLVRGKFTRRELQRQLLDDRDRDGRDERLASQGTLKIASSHQMLGERHEQILPQGPQQEPPLPAP